MNKNIKENSFEGGVAGAGGTSNYSVGYGTFASPNVSQNPSSFGTSPTPYNKNVTDDTATSSSLSNDIDTLFTKKETPTPDEIMAGMQFELGKMIKKDKRVAKQTVITNLKQNPRFYSELGSLNMDDKKMVVKENYMKNGVNIAVTKGILDQMIADKKGKREEMKMNDAIQDILKEKRDKKSFKTDELCKKIK
jgi:hypothetical protein